MPNPTESDLGMLPNADLGIMPPNPAGPAVTRGGMYFGSVEKFNRYYTDPSYRPTQILYVSPSGSGNGMTRDTPASVPTALGRTKPGTQIQFLPGTYTGCYELAGSAQSGTYDAPIVLYAERKPDGGRAVRINPCATGRRTGINLEASDYIAVDGFEIVGGEYGVRGVGAEYAASKHQRGLAVLNCEGHGQNRDPFFTGQSDWAVFEKNLAYDAGVGDGHGIYLSNGSDWNITRYNELYNNRTSDFQINADPLSTCNNQFSDPSCDAVAGTGEGGRGASDFMLVEGNYFHHGLGQGANFTSVRRSVVRNNIMAIYERHGVSFWQETQNPRLGSSDNLVMHNLFVAKNTQQMLMFINHSDRNQVRNNLFLGVSINGGNVTANPMAVWMEVDNTVSANQYQGNYYISGRFDGRTATAEETTRADFQSGWFANFPRTIASRIEDFRPTMTAPFIRRGKLLPEAPFDMTGKMRVEPVDIGPLNQRTE